MRVGLVGRCNPDFNIAQLGFITRWTPVKNLTFSGDLTWTRLDQKAVYARVFKLEPVRPIKERGVSYAQAW
jgi:hypothetical protein